MMKVELKLFETPGAVQLLFWLHDNPSESLYKKDIKTKILVSVPACTIIFDILWENQLIKIDPKLKVFKFILSEKGKELARILKGAHSILIARL
jgi:hypothetical protein